jgi:four helix bundle protein
MLNAECSSSAWFLPSGPVMVARTYRELVCWQLASDVKRRVYELTAKPSVAADFDFCKQIRGSARGAPRTIAEGFGRFRPADFARYLEFARASLIETQNHLDDALDAKYVTADEHAQLWKLADRALRATTKLHQYLQTCKSQRKGTSDPATPNRGTQNPEPENPEPGTENPEPRTKNEP